MIKQILKKALLLQLSLLFSCLLFAQQRTVTGKVTDSDGKGLPGISVQVKGSSTGVATNGEGAFVIVIPNDQAVLRFSGVGYVQTEQSVGARKAVDVTLQKDSKQLDDVVVVGYGTKKRVNIQGSVATVKAAEIEDLPVANLGSALINRVPGVSVNFASGKPGATTDINIRGASTFGSALQTTSQPLYVIDGIVVNPTIFSQSPNPDFLKTWMPARLRISRS